MSVVMYVLYIATKTTFLLPGFGPTTLRILRGQLRFVWPFLERGVVPEYMHSIFVPLLVIRNW